MSGIELASFESDDEIYVMDSGDTEVETKAVAGMTDPRRRLEDRLEEMRLKRELRELEMDYKI